MTQLTIRDSKYLVNEQELSPGMLIRRYDSAAPGWFTGEVVIVYGYEHETKQRIQTMGLAVDGFAPSPLVEGDEIELIEEDQP
jgi:hypothetical protein